MEKEFYVVLFESTKHAKKIWYSSLEEAKSLKKYNRIYNKEGELVYSPYEGE